MRCPAQDRLTLGLSHYTPALLEPKGTNAVCECTLEEEQRDALSGKGRASGCLPLIRPWWPVYDALSPTSLGRPARSQHLAQGQTRLSCRGTNS